MSSKKHKYFFNLDIYEESADKEYKAKLVPLDEFVDVYELIKQKYGLKGAKK